jgi:hypothetical protein
MVSAVRNMLLITFVALGLTGCLPYHFTLRPGVSGVVLDGRDSTPITNATIVVTTRDSSRQTGEIVLTTTADGAFYVPPKQRWSVYIMPMDVFGPWSKASISAPGYASRSFDLSASAMGPKAVSLGNVSLAMSQ